MGNLTLVMGGIKTGKTRFAQERAAEYDRRNEPVVYLATARAFDSEMEDRIARHQADRPNHWKTVEEPFEIGRACRENGGDAGVVLVDCLTLWMTNVMADEMPMVTPGSDEERAGGAEILPDRDKVWNRITAEMDALASAAASGGRDIIVVSNQVEYGLVSEYAFGRLYQDLAGMTHQYLAARADRVYSMIAGIPLCLKEPGK